MSTHNTLPELALSKNGARYLLKRNASAEALFRKQCFLIDKAKAKRKKVYDRERELLRQSQEKREVQTSQLSSLSSCPIKTFSRTEGEKKWEIDSDTTSYAKLTGKQGFSLNNKTSLASSYAEHIVPVSNNQCGDQRLTEIPWPEPAEVPSGSSRRLKSLSCLLPPLQSLSPRKYSKETEAVLFKTADGKRDESFKTLNKLNFV